MFSILNHFKSILKIAAVGAIILMIVIGSSTSGSASVRRVESIGIGTSLQTGNDSDSLPLMLDQFNEAGIKWIREEIPWSEVEQAPGEFRWHYGHDMEYLDFPQMINLINARDMHLLAVLDTGPVYLQHQYPNQPINPDQLVENWANYVNAVVEKFGDSIDAWEIGGAVNDPAVWGKVVYPTVPGATAEPDPFLYTRLLSTASNIIKAHDPNDLVIAGGFSVVAQNCEWSVERFLAMINNAQAWDSFDLLGLQPDWGTFSPETKMSSNATVNPDSGGCSIAEESTTFDLVGKIKSIQAFMQNYGEKPIWITEIGWQDNQVKATADQLGVDANQIKTNYLARSLVALINEPGIEKVFWQGYDRYDGTTIQNLDPTSQQALHNISESLSNSIQLGQYQTVSSSAGQQSITEEFRFRKNGKLILIAWNTLGGSQPVPVEFKNVDAKSVRAYATNTDSFSKKDGYVINVQPDKTFTIQLTEWPVLFIAEPENVFQEIKFSIEDRATILANAVKGIARGWMNTLVHAAEKEAQNLFEKALTALTDWFFGLFDKKTGAFEPTSAVIRIGITIYQNKMI